MIKILIKNILSFLFYFIFNRITNKILFIINLILKILYSFYVASKFNYIKDGFMFEYPFIVKGGKYISIGNRFSTRSGFRIEAWDSYFGNLFKPTITIGNNVIINFDCHIGAINKIIIGNNVLIGSRVLIIDHNHGQINKDELTIPPFRRELFSKGPVIIEDNVWICEGVCILPNVTIGCNSIIAANSVVTMNIPDNCVAGGIPAKVLKYL